MNRSNPIALDPLLTAAFFQVPKVSADNITVDLKFKIPSDKATLAQFFVEHEEEFLVGVAGLVKELKILAEKQGILDERVKTGLEKFLTKCRFTKDNSSAYYIDSVFPLLTQGVTEFAEIIAIMEQDEKWSDSRKKLIEHMLSRFNAACEPVMSSYIHDTRLALSLDLKKELMSFRRFLAKQMAQKVVDKHNQKYGGELEIATGSDEHYISAMLDIYKSELGLEKTDDRHAERYQPTAEMKDEFVQLMNEDLNAGYIIEQIMDKYEQQTYRVKPDQAAASWFDKFGSDSRPLNDLLEDENNEGQAKPHVDYYVRNILFMRLVSSGVFDLTKMAQHTLPAFSGATFYIPPVKSILLAYVSFDEKYKSDEPFILFYLNTVFEDLKNGTDRAEKLEQLCDEAQLEILRNEAVRLIGSDWSPKMVTLSAEDAAIFKEYLIKLSEVFNTPETWQILLRLLTDARHDAAHLAKGLYLVWDAGFITDEVIAFLSQHAADADHLAELLDLFHDGLGVEIDTSLFSLLASRKRKAREFSTFLQDKKSLHQLMNLVVKNIFDVESMSQLLDHVDHVNDIVITLTSLYALNPTLCAQAVTAIIQKGGNLNLLNFVRGMVEYCQDKKIYLSSDILDKIFNNDTYRDLSVNSDTPLLAMAILFKEAEVCRLLLANGATVVDTISVNISLLQSILPDSKSTELSEFLQVKTGFTQPNPDSEVVVTAKELAQVVGDKDVLACFETPKTEPTVEMLTMFKSSILTDPNSPVLTEGQELPIHPKPPAFDQ